MRIPKINFINNHTIFGLMVLAILVFCAITILLNLPEQAINKDYIPPDSFTYINAAKSFYNGFNFSPTRPMGYAVLVGLPHLIYSIPSNEIFISWSYILNFSLWLGTVYFLYKSLLVFAPRVTAFLFSCIFIFCFSNIAQASVILTETTSCFLLTLLIYFLTLFTYQKRAVYLGVVTLIITLSVLVKPGFIYLGVIFNLIWLGHHISIRKPPSLKMVIPLALLYLMIFVQCYQNLIQHGNFTLSYIDKYTWYLYVGAEASAEYKNISIPTEIDTRNELLEPMPWKGKYELSKQDLSQQLKYNKKLIFKHILLNIIENGHRGNPRISAVGYQSNYVVLRYIRHYLYLFSRLQNVLLSLTAIFLCFTLILTPLRKSLLMWMLCSIIFYVIFTSGISFWQGDRFHMILYPLIIFGFARFGVYKGWFQSSEEEILTLRRNVTSK